MLGAGVMLLQLVPCHAAHFWTSTSLTCTSTMCQWPWLLHSWSWSVCKQRLGSATPFGAQGVLQRLACDGPDSPWLLTGTSRGHLTLWDMRFQLPLTQWDHPSGQPVEALAPAVAPVGHLGLRGGGKGSSPLVYIAAGGHEVGLWDIEEGKCHQVRFSKLLYAIASLSSVKWLSHRATKRKGVAVFITDSPRASWCAAPCWFSAATKS